jgi:hypothetical protein
VQRATRLSEHHVHRCCCLKLVATSPPRLETQNPKLNREAATVCTRLPPNEAQRGGGAAAWHRPYSHCALPTYLHCRGRRPHEPLGRPSDLTNQIMDEGSHYNSLHEIVFFCSKFGTGRAPCLHGPRTGNGVKLGLFGPRPVQTKMPTLYLIFWCTP